MNYDPDLAVGSRLEYVLSSVGVELLRAQAKHPPIASIHEGYAVISEEVAEYFDACRGQVPNVKQAHIECVHIAAMAVRTILDTAQRKA